MIAKVAAEEIFYAETAKRFAMRAMKMTFVPVLTPNAIPGGLAITANPGKDAAPPAVPAPANVWRLRQIPFRRITMKT